jgi:hypothetical protein
VSGATLAERLRRGPLPLKEAVSLGKQIAEGLEAAHAKNLIHRDLKPANIKIGDNGQVKVLDFGLAKSVARPLEVSPESTTATLQDLTQKMEAVGTPACMSPEQACGKELDTRTDIWSFGCVLYEALSGKQAFRGKTITEIVAAVVEREPDWAALPAAMPASLLRLLKRCLRKERDNRLHGIADARLELEDLLAGGTPESAGASQPAITRRTAIAALSGAAAGAAATGVLAISRYRSAAPRKLTQFVIMAPDSGLFVPSFNKARGYFSGRHACCLQCRSWRRLRRNIEKDAKFAYVLSLRPPFRRPDVTDAFAHTEDKPVPPHSHLEVALTS